MMIIKAAVCAVAAVCAAPAYAAVPFTADFTTQPALYSNCGEGRAVFNAGPLQATCGSHSTFNLTSAGFQVFTEGTGVIFTAPGATEFGLDAITLSGAAFNSFFPLKLTYTTTTGVSGALDIAKPNAGITTTTLGLSSLRSAQFSIYLSNFTITSLTGTTAPEPSTWALMLAGFGLTGYALRRRRARVAFA